MAYKYRPFLVSEISDFMLKAVRQHLPLRTIPSEQTELVQDLIMFGTGYAYVPTGLKLVGE